MEGKVWHPYMYTSSMKTSNFLCLFSYSSVGSRDIWKQALLYSLRVEPIFLYLVWTCLQKIFCTYSRALSGKLKYYIFSQGGFLNFAFENSFVTQLFCSQYCSRWKCFLPSFGVDYSPPVFCSWLVGILLFFNLCCPNRLIALFFWSLRWKSKWELTSKNSWIPVNKLCRRF